MDSGPRLPEIESFWGNYSLCLSVLICEIGILIVPTSESSWANNWGMFKIMHGV